MKPTIGLGNWTSSFNFARTVLSYSALPGRRRLCDPSTQAPRVQLPGYRGVRGVLRRVFIVLAKSTLLHRHQTPLLCRRASPFYVRALLSTDDPPNTSQATYGQGYIYTRDKTAWDNRDRSEWHWKSTSLDSHQSHRIALHRLLFNPSGRQIELLRPLACNIPSSPTLPASWLRLVRYHISITPIAFRTRSVEPLDRCSCAASLRYSCMTTPHSRHCICAMRDGQQPHHF
ncbi:hypothetical protein F5B21DRAFT_375143 [Xylaria acuta]|nr:hypothetical protein F5B21DRAFT_375143 [Xylaria acuta]